MKRVGFLALILAFAISGAAFAEDEKGPKIKSGNILVGAGTELGFGMTSRTTTPDTDNAVDQLDDTMDFELGGQMGYFVIDGLELGPMAAVMYSKATQTFSEGDSETTTTSTGWMLGAQIGYFADLDSIAVPYGMLRAAYFPMSVEVEIDDGSGNTSKFTHDESGYMAGPRLGANIFITRSIALDLGLYFNYNSSSGTDKNGSKTDFSVAETEYGLDVGFNVFF